MSSFNTVNLEPTGGNAKQPENDTETRREQTQRHNTKHQTQPANTHWLKKEPE